MYLQCISVYIAQACKLNLHVSLFIISVAVTGGERGRSKTFSGHTHSRPTPSEPGTRPPVLPRPRTTSRSSTSPPPPPLPTVTERVGGGGEGGKGRGRERETEPGGRVPPSRPPPPARARSLPRGQFSTTLTSQALSSLQ